MKKKRHKFNYWNLALGIKNANAFLKELKMKIKDHVLIYMQHYGRAKWIPAIELTDNLGRYQGYNYKNPMVTKFFFLEGAQKEVMSSTNKLRRQGFPIISGKGKRGYRYADETCSDVTEIWDERFNAFEGRKDNIRKEREIDIKLLDKIIPRCKNISKKKQLIIIRNKFKGSPSI